MTSITDFYKLTVSINKNILVQFVVVSTLLLAWELLVSWHPDTMVPKPSDCFGALYTLTTQGVLWPDLLASLQRVAIGFSIAVILGVIMGFSFGLIAQLKNAFMAIFELFRPIPPIAWIPIAVAVLGIGDMSAWFVIFIGAFYPVLTNTLLGVSGVDKLHIEAAKVLGASKTRTFFHVIWPSSLPSLFAGLRVGLGFAWMCVVAAEMFASRSGLGYEIQLNRQLFQLDRVVAGMITIAVIGFLMSHLMARLEWFFVPWRREYLSKDFFTNAVSQTSKVPTLRDSNSLLHSRNTSEQSSAVISEWEQIGGTSVSIEGLEFSYPGHERVLQGINLTVNPGEVFCLLGVSGCGKSTLLRLLAGLEANDNGNIVIGNKKLTDSCSDATMVFQNFSLFPWKSVEKNVLFAVQQRDSSAAQKQNDIHQLLSLVGLEHKSRFYPHQLSGGQQQRVAFARALATRPRLILLDEPFSSLDSLTRETLQYEVSSLFKRTGITVIMVTHDIAEAVFMADRIAIMSPIEGNILCEFAVTASRPRGSAFRNSSEFRELFDELWQYMQPKEMTKHLI
jgi:ABC-type nitrate/sulfonate/bicarbonate transport system ATPase subunit/ABC-type nitrate/sulfonate/bicarbonate transport system permease component